MKRIKTIFTSFFLTALLSSFAVAGGFGKGMRPCQGDGLDPAYHLEKMSVMLDLSAEQQARISDILAQNRMVSAPARVQLKQDREALRDVRQADIFDQEKARELAHRLADSRVDVMAQRHHIRQQVEEILTPEQIAKKHSLRQLHEQRRGQQHARNQVNRQKHHNQ